MDILSLLGGLLLILLGANGLTDGAASIAKRFRIPSIVIGLTIVAFGTSAPGHRHRKRCRQQYLQYTDDCRLYGTLRSNCYFQKYTAQGNPALYPILHSIADLRE